jgi:hypothetical protein
MAREPTIGPTARQLAWCRHDGRLPDNSSRIDGDVTPTRRHTALVMAAAFYIEGAIAAP